MTRDNTVTLFVNAAQTITCAGSGRARRGAEMRELGVGAGVGVAIQGERIIAVALDDELRRSYANAGEVDCARGLLAPGFVDSHTHALFGSPRFAEHELRATGVPYMEIAEAGGGIHSSVRDLRATSSEELIRRSIPRVQSLIAGGVSTIEVKSGYGLSVVEELRSLRAIRALADIVPVRLVATCLGAHEIPMERRQTEGGRQEWIDAIAHELHPAVAAEGLARFVDVFCEPGVFSVEETRQLVAGAPGLGLGIKLHADELHDGDAAALGASVGAVSVDHLAAISPRGISALAASNTVATLLPGTMLFLGTGRQAPARALINAGVPVALASDFNPGSSPLTNFPLLLTLAVSELRMSAAEAWIAATVNGAAALGLAKETGQLAVGYSADLAIHEVDDFRALPYWFGARLCREVWSRGRACPL